MSKEEKEELINEIVKHYKYKNNLNYNLNLEYAIKSVQLLFVLENLNNIREIYQILVNNIYGNLAFMLYEYKNMIDNHIYSIIYSFDKRWILQLMELDGCLLRYVSETLRKDRDVVLKAITNNEEAMQYISLELLNDKYFIIRAIKDNYLIFDYLNDNLKHDKDVVREYSKYAYNNEIEKINVKKM